MNHDATKNKKIKILLFGPINSNKTRNSRLRDRTIISSSSSTMPGTSALAGGGGVEEEEQGRGEVLEDNNKETTTSSTPTISQQEKQEEQQQQEQSKKEEQKVDPQENDDNLAISITSTNHTTTTNLHTSFLEQQHEEEQEHQQNTFMKSVCTLHKGKAGPFDVVFVVGTSWIRTTTTTTTTTTTSNSINNYNTSTTTTIPFLEQLSSIGIPIYFHHLIVISKSGTDTTTSTGTAAATTTSATTSSSNPPLQCIAENIFVLHSLITTTSMHEGNNSKPIKNTSVMDGGGSSSSSIDGRTKTTGIWSIQVSKHHPDLIVVATAPNIQIHEQEDKMNNKTKKVADNYTSSETKKKEDDDDIQSLLDNLKHPSYQGCDLLFTHEWPQGIESCLTNLSSSSSLYYSEIQKEISYDIGMVALLARARYHIVEGPIYQQSVPFEHLPTITNTGIHQSQVLHVGRLISLHSIVDTPTNKSSSNSNTAKTMTSSLTPQQSKFNHAIGVIPLQYMSVTELMAQRPNPILPCPYTDTSYNNHHHPSMSTATRAGSVMSSTMNPHSVNAISTGGLSEASARRILAEERQRNQHPIPGQRWTIPHHNSSVRHNGSNSNRKTNRQDEFQDHGTSMTVVVDPTNTTLFLHGLHQDVTGQLQVPMHGDPLILQAIGSAGYLGLQQVRRPTVRGSSGHHQSQHRGGGGNHNSTTGNSSFCFLQFETHQQACTCLQESGGTILIHGIPLQLKWATTTANSNITQRERSSTLIRGGGDGGEGIQPNMKRPRLTENEAQESTTVYYKLPPKVSSNEYQDVGEWLRQFMETTLENALAMSGNNDNENNTQITAAEEPALQVQLRLPSNNNSIKDEVRGSGGYGFLDFASHAAASMALATLTGSTDGGRLSSDIVEQKTRSLTNKNCSTPIDYLEGLYLHWGTKPTTKKTLIEGKPNLEKDIIEDEGSKFRFERKHFPPDSRTDCWFCLASESCERHLITGVYDQFYTALPKGGAHPGHVLLIPVQHASEGVFRDRLLVEEMERMKKKLRAFVAEVYHPKNTMDLFVFERAIETKHGYHTHVHCLPVEQRLGPKLLSTMYAQAHKIGFELHEVNSDLGLDVILTTGAKNEVKQGTRKEVNQVNSSSSVKSGYFYAEIPTGSGGYRRILYQCASSLNTDNDSSIDGDGVKGGDRRPRPSPAVVPLQFGREVLAAVLGNPDIAHWKSCLVDKEQETMMAVAFRESFAPYEAE